VILWQVFYCFWEILGQIENCWIKYDKEVDILVIRISDKKIVDSDELRKGIILDYDENGNVVKIEILDASKKGDSLTKIEYELVPS
jgi:uncharacterized protein YuzE